MGGRAAAASQVVSVSCPPAGRCWAVGAINPGTQSAKPLAEHCTGKRWSVVHNAAPGGNVLSAVSCRRNTSCWAVGNGDEQTPAERWNGTRWSLAKTPPTAGGLNGVSCPGTDCFAVGFGGFPAALAERWNGSRWSVMHTPQPVGSQAAGYRGVSCLSSSDCFAAGLYFKNLGSDVSSTLIERLRGSTWVIVRSPNPAGAGLADMHAVACASARACWAVGEQEKTPDVTPSRTPAERWNGTRWTIVPTP